MSGDRKKGRKGLFSQAADGMHATGGLSPLNALFLSIMPSTERIDALMFVYSDMILFSSSIGSVVEGSTPLRNALYRDT